MLELKENDVNKGYTAIVVMPSHFLAPLESFSKES